MTPDDLIDEIKDDLTAAEWSQAVICNRRGDAVFHHQDGDVIVYDVLMTRRLPYRVEIEVDELDWLCPCNSKSGTCAHVAAAALAYKQSLGRGMKPLQRAINTPTSVPHLGYRIWSVPEGWVLRNSGRFTPPSSSSLAKNPAVPSAAYAVSHR